MSALVLGEIWLKGEKYCYRCSVTSIHDIIEFSLGKAKRYFTLKNVSINLSRIFKTSGLFRTERAKKVYLNAVNRQ